MIFRKLAGADIELPLIGQGTWMIGENGARIEEEIRALRLGLDLGMTHIDTAEMYGNGAAEELVGRAIAGRRAQVFLVSKVLPSNASYRGTLQACENSLARLRTDVIDLYLLHWWSDSYPLEETMRAMEELVRAGKIRFIGVSNFDVRQLQRAQKALNGARILCNQVCYHLKARGIEYSLIPYCENHDVAVVGYSPFGSGNFVAPESREGKVLAEIARRHGKSPRQVALNFLARRHPLFAIPKSSRAEHVRENAGAVGWELSAGDLEAMDRAFPPPVRETPLAMI